jgi:YidC/Oxa1 family membrane protein insertase
VFAVSGVNFPIGVLIYWLVTNVWSMGQQFYVIRRMPAPGSIAEQQLQARRAKRGHGSAAAEDDGAAAIEAARRGQRHQPKRKDRQRRPARPDGKGGSGSPGDTPRPGDTAAG